MNEDDFTPGREQAADLAERAFASMQQYGIAPTPPNFRVWYSYHADRPVGLRRMLDAVIANHQMFTDKTNADIYQQFFGVDPQQVSIKDIARRLEETMSQVQAFVGDAEGDTRAYGQALENFTGQMTDGVKTSTSLTSLISNLINDTKEMQVQTRTLEDRLSQSTQEIDELRRNVDALRLAAETDSLTGLANRKSFEQQLAEMAAMTQAGGGPLSLLLVDIDHFKLFNDTWGHQVGDQVLRLMARTMVENVKGQDFPARYGGEEFAILLPGTGLEDALIVGNTIRTALQGKKLVKKSTGEDMGRITISMGVASYVPGERLGGFVHRADEALYTAKREGRNRVVSERDLPPAAQNAAGHQDRTGDQNKAGSQITGDSQGSAAGSQESAGSHESAGG